MGSGLLACFALVLLHYGLFFDAFWVKIWYQARLVANLAGGLLFFAFMVLPVSRGVVYLARFSGTAYFLYLIHLMLIDLSKDVLPMLPGYGSLLFAAVSSCVIYLAALGLAILVSRKGLMKCFGL